MTERLTKQDIVDIINYLNHMTFPRSSGKEITSRILNEMFEYKTIEEEYGINLITVFKALKYGVYEVNIETHHYGNGETVTEKHFTHYDIDYINKQNQLVYYYYSLGDWEHEKRLYKYFDFKDYDKTWALTREELE